MRRKSILLRPDHGLFSSTGIPVHYIPWPYRPNLPFLLSFRWNAKSTCSAAASCKLHIFAPLVRLKHNAAFSVWHPKFNDQQVWGFEYMNFGDWGLRIYASCLIKRKCSTARVEVTRALYFGTEATVAFWLYGYWWLRKWERGESTRPKATYITRIILFCIINS